MLKCLAFYLLISSALSWGSSYGAMSSGLAKSLTDVSNGTAYCDEIKSCDPDDLILPDKLIKDFQLAISLQNCGCNEDRTPFTRRSPHNDRVKELRELQRICNCYIKQPNVESILSSEEMQQQIKTKASNLLEYSQKRFNSLMSYLFYGPEAQALFLSEGNESLSGKYKIKHVDHVEPNPSRPVLSNMTESVVSFFKRTTNLLADKANGQARQISETTNLTQPVKPAGSKLDPDRELIDDMIKGSNSGVDADNCVSMQSYLTYKQTPDSPEFYQFLSSQKSFVAEEWNLNTLKSRLKERLDDVLRSDIPAGEDPEVRSLKSRIKFIFANPLYATTFSIQASKPEEVAQAKEIQEKLFKNIKDNFTPKCDTEDKVICALNKNKDRKKVDRKFFQDPDVQEFVKNSTSNGVRDFIKDAEKNSELYMARLRLPSAEMRSPLGMNGLDKEKVVKNCSIITQSSISQGFSSQETSRYTEADRSVADFIGELADEFSFKKDHNLEFKKLNQRVCNQKRCKSKSFFCSAPDAKTFAEWLSDKKINSQNFDESDWVKAQEEYLGEYSRVLKSSSSMAVSSSDNEGERFRKFLGKTDPSKLTQQARTEAINHAASDGTKGDVISYRRVDTSVDSSAAADDSGYETIRRPASEVYRSERSSVAAATQESATTLNPETPKVEARNTAVAPQNSTPILSDFNYSSISGLTPEIQEQVTKAIESEKRDAVDFESQANAIASQVTSTEDLAQKEKLQKQIEALTFRADASDKKASELERQLAEAEKRAEADAKKKSSSENVARSETAPERIRESSRAPASQAPSIAPQTSQVAQPSSAPVQNLGGGSAGSVSVPVALSSLKGRSGSMNLNFKYASDAKIKSADSSGPGIIVAGASSSFNATEELGSAVNSSKAVDIGTLTSADAQLIASGDPQVLNRYAKKIRETDGNIVRLVYSEAGTNREVIIAKAADGTLFVPSTRNLAKARSRAATLSGMRSLLDSTTK